MTFLIKLFFSAMNKQAISEAVVEVLKGAKETMAAAEIACHHQQGILHVHIQHQGSGRYDALIHHTSMQGL